MLLLFLLFHSVNAGCKNRFAGCDGFFNRSAFNGTLTVAAVVVVPSPAVIPYDNTLDLLMAGIEDEPWKCNVSAWGGVVWNRCRAPDTTICTIEPLSLAPSPSISVQSRRRLFTSPSPGSSTFKYNYNSNTQSKRNVDTPSSSVPSPFFNLINNIPSTKRRLITSPSPNARLEESCRAQVALATIVDGWCNEEAICDVTCSSNPLSRRVLDMYVQPSGTDCPIGWQVQPSNIAFAWFVAAMSMVPAICLSSWRMWVLILRSRLHWRSYWVGCGVFSNLIFRWPIGRVIFCAFAGGISICLLSFRKFDKIGIEHSEEASILGIDLFVGATFASGTYLWFVAVTSIPLALGHRAMTIELPQPKKVGLGSNTKDDNETNIIDLSGSGSKTPTNGKENEDGNANDNVNGNTNDEENQENQEKKRMNDDTILRRLGMRSRHTEKSKCLQTCRRNFYSRELRKYEAIQDVRSPMKPSDRHACSHSLYKKTWQIQSFLNFILLALSSTPAVFSVILIGPSPTFWALAIRAMHGGYAFCLVMWWLRFSAAVPSVKRVLGAQVVRPPGDPGKPTNGSKKSLDAWRERVNEARSRLSPVMIRFVKIESITRIMLTIIIAAEVLVAMFYELYIYLPILEPVRWILTSPIFFVVVWILPPMPRRTGRSVYKTTTLIELMQPVKKKVNPQDGSSSSSQQTVTNQYVVPTLLTDDMTDTDTKEAAMLRLHQLFVSVSECCPGYDERDVKTLLYRFDSIAGISTILSADGFLNASNTAYEDNALTMRWFNSLNQNHGVVGGQGGQNKQRIHGIDFVTYGKAMFDMCTASRPRLAMLVFEMYDTDHGGDLDRDEIRVLLAEVNHTSEEDAISEEDIDLFDADRGGTVDTEEFANAVQSFPALLRPAYTLQRKLRDSTLSLRRWEQITQNRLKVIKQREQYEREQEEEMGLEIIEIE